MQQRRRDPYPWTFEIPLGLCAAIGLVTCLAAQVGRSAAVAWSGQGWRWPVPQTFVTSLAGIMRGDASAGLPGAMDVNPVTLWLAICLAEVATLAGCAWLGRLGWRRWEPQALRGVATASY